MEYSEIQRLIDKNDENRITFTHQLQLVRNTDYKNFDELSDYYKLWVQ